MIFKKVSFYLAIAGLFLTVRLVTHLRKEAPIPAPLIEPSRSPYQNSIAATGIIEAANENVKIATSKAGLITAIPVKVGAIVRTGDLLLELDGREINAKGRTVQAEIKALEAELQREKITLADAEDQYLRAVQLHQEEALTEEELKRKQFQAEGARAQITKAEKEIESKKEQLKSLEVDLSLLSIKAPQNGTVLQLNARVGEYAALNPSHPLMILGDLRVLQVRAEVDEQNAPIVLPGQPAVAFLKGKTDLPIPLRFVRIEPYIIPKQSLTGESTERVDTRVLQVVFEFDLPALSVYVGQQVDVFIQRP
jgi:RND family efflux transporter MFP subunit